MSIRSIKIQYYKSIKDCCVPLQSNNIIVGENGVGKSNFLSAIHYFYANMTESHLQSDIFDENNPFSNFVRIQIEYDLSRFVRIAKNKIKAASQGASSPYLSFTRKFISSAVLTHTSPSSFRWNRSKIIRFAGTTLILTVLSLKTCFLFFIWTVTKSISMTGIPFGRFWGRPPMFPILKSSGRFRRSSRSLVIPNRDRTKDYCRPTNF